MITQSANWYSDYGITDRVNVIVSVPYIWTHASQGILHGTSGLQDITLAAKYDFYRHSFTKVGDLRLIGVIAGSIPLTYYTPDFQPLSIGFASKQISTRLTVNLQTRPEWGRMAVTPMGTFLPSVTIACPTITPVMSMIALSGPGGITRTCALVRRARGGVGASSAAQRLLKTPFASRRI